jgi:antibiotic biosynthesis monooxygenase (ABM) superfamily enzyme
MDEPGASTVPIWKIAVAFILDLFTVAVIGSYAINLLAALLTNLGTPIPPALILPLLLLVVIGYFVISGPAFGGTFWQRILKTRRPKTDL